MLVARYWTKLFIVVCALSYCLVYPFEILFPIVEQLFSVVDSAQVRCAPCPPACAPACMQVLSSPAHTLGPASAPTAGRHRAACAWPLVDVLCMLPECAQRLARAWPLCPCPRPAAPAPARALAPA